MTNWKAFRPGGVPHPFALSLTDEKTMFVSGFGGHDAHGNIAANTREQTEQAMRTLSHHLAREGFSLEEVVWIHPYLVDVADAAEMDAVLSATFGDAPPASGAMIAGIQLADPRMRVEFEAIAVRGAHRVRVTE